MALSYMNQVENLPEYEDIDEHPLNHEVADSEQVSEKAIQWCNNNPGWKRICDIENHENLYKTWEELSPSTRRQWANWYPDSPKDAWEEFGYAPCKFPSGFIGGDGKFYTDIREIPKFFNSMMVFKI